MNCGHCGGLVVNDEALSVFKPVYHCLMCGRNTATLAGPPPPVVADGLDRRARAHGEGQHYRSREGHRLANLALSWLVKQGINWDDVLTRFIRRGEFPRRVFADGELRKSWYHYHKDNARMRSLCQLCHQQRLGMNERKVLE